MQPGDGFGDYAVPHGNVFVLPARMWMHIKNAEQCVTLSLVV